MLPSYHPYILVPTHEGLQVPTRTRTRTRTRTSTPDSRDCNTLARPPAPPSPSPPVEQVPTQVNYVVKSAAIYDPGETISGATSVITKYLGTAYLWDKVAP